MPAVSVSVIESFGILIFIGCNQSHFDFRWAILVLRIGSNAAHRPDLHAGNPNRVPSLKSPNVVKAGLEVLTEVMRPINKQTADGSQSNGYDQYENYRSDHI